MVRVSIVGARGEVSTLELPEGERLLDACDEAHAPISFSCRNASCAVCRVDVRRGAELFEAPSAEERELLERVTAAPTQRLACRLVSAAADGDVVLEIPGSGG